MFNWPSIIRKSLGNVTIVRHCYPPSVPHYSVASPSEFSFLPSSLSVGTGVCVSHSLGSSLLLTVAFTLTAARRCSSYF